ncbi:MAG: TFIIB-type zinc finger domain-containing protein [Streptococcaceae bacterium]|jgi:hypothetical protein|nr:TFIIB-type zinc finger domain-containing protein [Streptococcaceae bacterium]
MRRKENLICQNCGGTNFVFGNGKTICNFCHTQYFTAERRRKSRKKIWFALVFVGITLLGIVFYLFLQTNEKVPTSQNETPLSSTEKKSFTPAINEIEKRPTYNLGYARKNISVIPGWTIEKYDAIKFASLKQDKNSDQGEYINGTNFSELVKEVGTPPDEVIEYTQYYPNGADIEVKAIWSSQESLPDGSVSLSVTYEKESEQILNKTLSGQIY